MALPPPPTLLDEITDFLLERPTPKQIIAFQPSDTLNDRLHDLLNKKTDIGLSLTEQEELDRFVQMGSLLTILRAKAKLKLRAEE